MKDFKRTVHVPSRGEVDVATSLAAIDTDNYEAEARESGAFDVWWGMLYAEAIAGHRRAVVSEGICKAQVRRAARDKYRALDLRATDTLLEEELLTNRDYQAAQEATIKAEEQMNILKSASYAASRKTSMLEKLAPQIGDELRARRGFLQRHQADVSRPTREAV